MPPSASLSLVWGCNCARNSLCKVAVLVNRFNMMGSLSRHGLLWYNKGLVEGHERPRKQRDPGHAET